MSEMEWMPILEGGKSRKVERPTPAPEPPTSEKDMVTK